MTRTQRLLVEENLDLPRKVVKKWFVKKVPEFILLEDLVSEGQIALIEAAQRFDPTKSDNFPAYAAKRIWGSVMDHLRSFDTLTRAQRAEMKRAQVEFSGGEVSLSEYFDCEDGGPSPHDILVKKEQAESLHRAMAKLTPRHAKAIQHYYFEHLNYKQVGKKLNVGESMACRLVKETLPILKRELAA